MTTRIEPLAKGPELRMNRVPREERTAILDAQGVFGVDGNTDVGAIQFLLDDHGVREQLNRLWARKHLVVARLARAEPHEMRRPGEANKLRHEPIFSRCFRAISSGQRKWISTPDFANAFLQPHHLESSA